MKGYASALKLAWEGKMKKLILFGVSIMCVVGSAQAAELSCHEAPDTMALVCIDEANVFRNGDVRSSAIYQGGPARVRKTSITMVVNCAKNVTTLQDRDSVNFAGNLSSTTAVSSTLSSWICGAQKTRIAKGLRQF